MPTFVDPAKPFYVEIEQSELTSLRARVARLEGALREARDFIMSGPTAGDEVAIVNKMSRALEEK